MALFEWLEQTNIGHWIGSANTIWAFPTIVTVHTLSMGIVAGCNYVIALRILGVGRQIPVAPMEKLYPLIWSGVASSIVSGALLFVGGATRVGPNPTFYIKLALVTLAIMSTQLLRKQAFGFPGLVQDLLPS